MKFNKELPKRSGIYWYVSTEYPIPKVCFLSLSCNPSYGHTMWELCCGGGCVLKELEYKYYRWGDEIVPPECVNNEIEY